MGPKGTRKRTYKGPKRDQKRAKKEPKRVQEIEYSEQKPKYARNLPKMGQEKLSCFHDKNLNLNETKRQ